MEMPKKTKLSFVFLFFFSNEEKKMKLMVNLKFYKKNYGYFGESSQNVQ
jgi:hypothetical protein